MLCLLVNIGFQVLFHSPPGVLFNFPSRYFFTIGHQVVFSLRGWSPVIHTRFLVSRTTLDTAMLIWISLTGLSPSSVHLPRVVHLSKISYAVNLGSFPFARRYWENRFCFLFLQLLRYFNSLGLAYLSVYHVFFMVSCLIRISTDHCLLTATRSVSPLVTSFFAF